MPLVRRPSRYIGGEAGSVLKDPASVRLSFALAFPDTYEVGISHLGCQILYQILSAEADFACERVYAPWGDMEALLREKELPLTALESGRALSDFDILGFSMQYELSFTNILNMLDLGGIPLLQKDRGEGDTLVIGGGPATFNPEPVADFFDAFLLGDGEEAIVDISKCVADCKEEGLSREETLIRLAGIEGIYVPSFYEISYKEDGTIEEIRSLKPDLGPVRRRIVKDINDLPDPVKPVVPIVTAVHDRLTVEIARGCTRGCRFCHAGMVTRPIRERDPQKIIDIVKEGLRNTGYDEVSLLSLSTGDYCNIGPVITALMQSLKEERTSVSLPSLRVGTLTEGLAEEIRKVKKTGFTMAPEAGTERLRRVINKVIEEDALVDIAKTVYELGWRSIKLYFMIGLPTETKGDIDGIIGLADRVRAASGQPRPKFKKKKPARNTPVNVSVGTYVPKPFTPFQWEAQISLDETYERQRKLRGEVESLGLSFKWNDAKLSNLEGVFSRGDRRLANAVLGAFNKGARFDGWSECFKNDLWQEVFVEEFIDVTFYTTRRRDRKEILPWDHLDCGVTKEFLLKDLDLALAEEETPDCKTSRCTDCGVCDFKEIKNIVSELAESLDGHTVKRRPAPDVPGLKARLKFTKRGPIRLAGHLELMTTVSRAIRRARLPVAHSAGFHPHPKISFSNPLPVGMESDAEYMDIEFTCPVTVANLPDRLNRVLPDGLRFIEASVIGLKTPALSATMKGNEYLIDVTNGPADAEGLGIDFIELERRIESFLAKDQIPITVRRKEKLKELDLKPFIDSILLEDESKIRLVLKTSVGLGREGGGVKPHECITALLNLRPEDALLIPILKTRTVL